MLWDDSETEKKLRRLMREIDIQQDQLPDGLGETPPRPSE
jgi:hypothetical protein